MPEKDMTERYLRDTHDEKGVVKDFSAEAKEAWRTATCNGHLLDSTQPMTLSEIVNEHKLYDKDNPSDPHGWNSKEIYKGLLQLVKYDLVKLLK